MSEEADLSSLLRVVRAFLKRQQPLTGVELADLVQESALRVLQVSARRGSGRLDLGLALHCARLVYGESRRLSLRSARLLEEHARMGGASEVNEVAPESLWAPGSLWELLDACPGLGVIERRLIVAVFANGLTTGEAGAALGLTRGQAWAARRRALCRIFDFLDR